MKYILLFLCLLSSVACTKLSIGYSLGSRQIKGRIQDSFDFDTKKKRYEIDSTLSEQFDSHKNKVFAEFLDCFENLNLIANQKKISEEDLLKLYDRVKTAQVKNIGLFKESFKKVVFSIEDHELNSFKKYSSDKTNEFRKKLENETRFIEEKQENIEKTIRFFFDDISDDQRKIVQEFVNKNIKFYKNQIEVRKGFFDNFIKLYPDHQKMMELAIGYYSGDQLYRDLDYIKERQAFEKEVAGLILKIWDNSSLKQRKNFFEVLSEIILNLKNEIK